MPESDTIQPNRLPVTMATLTRDLRALGVQPGMTLLVHSSLSALGWVAGGPHAVLLALAEVLGAAGTLVMPTHSTHLTDPAQWENPPVPEAWWPIIRSESPAYDPDLTPTREMGQIAESFRTQPGTVRSAHPHHSFAARGPLAAQLLADHMLWNGLGEQSPLARLYELDGWVLLLGVGHGNNTSLHLAEYRATWPGKRQMRQGAPLRVAGMPQWVWFEELDTDNADFLQLGAAFDAEGHTRIGTVGCGEARLMPQRELVDFGVEWMGVHRG